jgi:hypothetical protein
MIPLIIFNKIINTFYYNIRLILVFINTFKPTYNAQYFLFFINFSEHCYISKALFTETIIIWIDIFIKNIHLFYSHY